VAQEEYSADPVPIEVVLAPYAAKTDARRAARPDCGPTYAELLHQQDTLHYILEATEGTSMAAAARKSLAGVNAALRCRADLTPVTVVDGA